MSRRGDGSLFVGRLSKDTRTRDLEDIFEVYGRLTRCDIKYGAEMAYAFLDFEDRRDAEDAIKFENGRDVRGSSIIVEWAKGSPRRPLVKEMSPDAKRSVCDVELFGSQGFDECYRCQRPGHWARDCPGDRRRRSPSPSYRSSYRRRSRSRSRDRRRSRSRERRHRSRSRSRSRDHRRSRSRSSDRGSSGRRAGSENGSRRSRSDSRD